MGREQYDNKIFARDLKVGDKLHLTFMGGDDYVVINNIKKGRGKVAWEGICWGELKDVINENEELWIKKDDPVNKE